MIICSDAKNEADDQFAIVHAILTASFQIQGFVAGHYSQENSMMRSFEEIVHLTRLLDVKSDIPILRGAKKRLIKGQEITSNEGVEFIIRKARENTGDKIFLLCLGALTDIAIALELAPDIASQLIVVWVGGGRYPNGSAEANLMRDLLSVNLVFQSEVELWQLPSNVYKQILVSIASLKMNLRHQSEVADYLLFQLMEFIEEFKEKKDWINTECWVFGDSAAIGVLLEEQKGSYKMHVAPHFLEDGRHDFMINNEKRAIRVYDSINDQLILSDMIAKIQLFSDEKKGII